MQESHAPTGHGVDDVSAESGSTKGAGDSHTQFVGSIPEIYDGHLGPLLFEFSAADLARRVAEQLPGGGRILEVACGTGISTEHLWRGLSAGTEILATDLNPAMIEFARQKRGGLANVTYAQADALALPYADGAFDAAVCQFGIMFFPDKAKGLAELTRVVKPGGLIAFNVWDSLRHNQFAEIVIRTVAGFFEGAPPSFFAVPFSYYSIDPIKELLEQAGLTGIAIDVVSATVERPDAHHVARGLVEGNPVIHEIHERATAEPEVIVAAMAEALVTAFGPEPIKVPLQEIVFTARKPE